MLNRTFQNLTYQSTHCMLYSATYTVNVTYQNNIPSILPSIALQNQIYSSVFADLDRIEAEGSGIQVDNRSLIFANFYAIEQAVEGLLSGFLSLLEANANAGPNEVNGTSNLLLWNYVN